jgi:hypothetical protein
MTLRVYRITPAGRRIELVPVNAVPPCHPWELRGPLDWPACRCPRCAPKARTTEPDWRRHRRSAG